MPTSWIVTRRCVMIMMAWFRAMMPRFCTVIPNMASFNLTYSDDTCRVVFTIGARNIPRISYCEPANDVYLTGNKAVDKIAKVIPFDQWPAFARPFIHTTQQERLL